MRSWYASLLACEDKFGQRGEEILRHLAALVQAIVSLLFPISRPSQTLTLENDLEG